MPDDHERRRAYDRRIRYNHSYISGEIALTAPGPDLRDGHDRSLKTTAANSTKSGTRNRDRPAATATNASSGTTLVQSAGNEVRCPRPSRK
jgi:hypothetical protein